MLNQQLLLLLLLLSVAFSHKVMAQSCGYIQSGQTAFTVSPPDNWVADSKPGQSCVLYLQEKTWQTSPVLISARIADVKYTSADKLIEYSISEFQQEDVNFKYKLVKSMIVGDGNRVQIYDYQGDKYGSFDRVAYIQLDKAVGYIIFSAKEEADFNRYANALYDTIKSFKILSIEQK